MAHLVDTSILIRQGDKRSPDRPIALDSMRQLSGRGEALHVFQQNMMEFWAVATRPYQVNGLGLSVTETEAERQRLETLLALLPDPLDLYPRWVQIVNQFGVSGKPTHDARIVAAMLEHGLTHILTFNGKDFRRYAPLGLVVVDPSDV